MPKYVIGITGSSGKGSTTELVARILSKNGYKVVYNKNGSNITISRGMEDIAGMTSGRTWEADSCMRLPYSDTPARTMHKHIKSDFKRAN